MIPRVALPKYSDDGDMFAGLPEKMPQAISHSLRVYSVQANR